MYVYNWLAKARKMQLSQKHHVEVSGFPEFASSPCWEQDACAKRAVFIAVLRYSGPSYRLMLSPTFGVHGSNALSGADIPDTDGLVSRCSNEEVWVTRVPAQLIHAVPVAAVVVLLHLEGDDRPSHQTTRPVGCCPAHSGNERVRTAPVS